MLRTVIGACLAVASLAGCATIYPGPRTDANSKVAVEAWGLQRHGAYPDHKLLVRVFQGKDIQGTDLGLIRLSPDVLSGEVKLDQGVEYTLWITSIEAHFGGFTSCGFHIPLTPAKSETYTIKYRTRKADCEVVVARVDQQGTSARILQGSNVAGGTQFTARVTRY